MFLTRKQNWILILRRSRQIFVDVETGQEERVQPAQVKDFYVQKTRAFFKRVEGYLWTV